MKSVSLKAFPRALGRRAGAKKLRSEGRIPAVIYGRQAQPQNLEVNSREMEELIHHSISENLLVDLAVQEDGRPKRLALVQEVQHHPLSGKVIHIDFHEVAENEKVTISVPVESEGEPAGVKADGGVLEHVLFKVKVRGLAKDLPEQIVADVSALKIGEAIHLGELKVPAGVELVGDKKAPVFAVAAPRAEEEVAPAAGAAVPGEVEMIKEKKEEGAEGAAPAAKAGEKAAAAPAAKAGEKAAAAPAKGAAAEKKK